MVPRGWQQALGHQSASVSERHSTQQNIAELWLREKARTPPYMSLYYTLTTKNTHSPKTRALCTESADYCWSTCRSSPTPLQRTLLVPEALISAASMETTSPAADTWALRAIYLLTKTNKIQRQCLGWRGWQEESRGACCHSLMGLVRSGSGRVGRWVLCFFAQEPYGASKGTTGGM